MVGGRWWWYGIGTTWFIGSSSVNGYKDDGWIAGGVDDVKETMKEKDCYQLRSIDHLDLGIECWLFLELG